MSWCSGERHPDKLEVDGVQDDLNVTFNVQPRSILLPLQLSVTYYVKRWAAPISTNTFGLRSTAAMFL